MADQNEHPSPGSAKDGPTRRPWSTPRLITSTISNGTAKDHFSPSYDQHNFATTPSVYTGS